MKGHVQMIPSLLAMLVFLSLTAQAQPLQWQDSRFAIDECGIRYNGQPLPLGHDTTEWVRVLGPPDRRLPTKYWLLDQRDLGYLIWDSHGLALALEKAGDTLWVGSAIFFMMNLDSKEGRSQSLRNMSDAYGDGYAPISKEEEVELRSDSMNINSKISFHRANPRNYPFPITRVRSHVRLDGVLLDPFIRMEFLNPLRKKMGLPRFYIASIPAKLWRDPETRDYLREHVVGEKYVIDSTLHLLYALVPPRTCQGMSYFWALRYTEFHHLLLLRVSTYRPWENAIKHARQVALDQSTIDNVPGYKDGEALWRRKARLYDGEGRLKQHKDGKEYWLRRRP